MTDTRSRLEKLSPNDYIHYQELRISALDLAKVTLLEAKAAAAQVVSDAEESAARILAVANLTREEGYFAHKDRGMDIAAKGEFSFEFHTYQRQTAREIIKEAAAIALKTRINAQKLAEGISHGAEMAARRKSIQAILKRKVQQTDNQSEMEGEREKAFHSLLENTKASANLIRESALLAVGILDDAGNKAQEIAVASAKQIADELIMEAGKKLGEDAANRLTLLEDTEAQIAKINFKAAQDIKNEYLNSSIIEAALNAEANIAIAELRFHTAETIIFSSPTQNTSSKNL